MSIPLWFIFISPTLLGMLFGIFGEMLNPEGHSPRWWRRHPEAKAKTDANIVQSAIHPSKKSFKEKLWSWSVVGPVVLFLMAGGLTLMAFLPILADVFYLAGFILLIGKLLCDLEPRTRAGVILVVAVLLFAVMGINHKINNLYPFRLVSQIRFSCLATHLEYPNDRLSGQIWVNGFSDVRFTIDPFYAVAANRFEATLTTLNDRQAFEGMDQKAGDCKLHFLRGDRTVELPDLYLFPKDGGPPANIKTEFEDEIDKHMPESRSYHITCIGLEPHDKLTVNMWMMDADHPGHTPSALKIEGGYETSPSEGSKLVPFKEVCNIKQ